MKKQFKKFIEWFNLMENEEEIDSPSKVELTLKISYSSLLKYYNYLEKKGCLKVEGKGKSKRYIKVKNVE